MFVLYAVAGAWHSSVYHCTPQRRTVMAVCLVWCGLGFQISPNHPLSTGKKALVPLSRYEQALFRRDMS